MLKKVSVIIPFYSNLTWLFEALESALNQTYKNIEIIIVNDGSKEDMTSFYKNIRSILFISIKKIKARPQQETTQ